MKETTEQQPVRLDKAHYETPEFKAMVARNVRLWRKGKGLPVIGRFHNTVGDHLKNHDHPNK